MKLLLVHAAFPVTYWGFQHSLRIVDKRAALPPLGLVSVAALLPKEWTLRLVDVNVETLDDDAIAWAVLVSGMLVQKESILEIVTRARDLGRRTIVGGPACTTSPQLFDAADRVFCGEVEGRIEALVTAIKQPGAPHVLGGIPDLRPKLTSGPTPRYDLLDLRAYRSMSIQYSRGCPYDCEFCDIVEVFGRVPRTKPAPQVLAELDALFTLGWRGQLFFVDDNFIGNKKAVRALLPEIERWQDRAPRDRARRHPRRAPRVVLAHARARDTARPARDSRRDRSLRHGRAHDPIHARARHPARSKREDGRARAQRSPSLTPRWSSSPS